MVEETTPCQWQPPDKKWRKARLIRFGRLGFGLLHLSWLFDLSYWL